MRAPAGVCAPRSNCSFLGKKLEKKRRIKMREKRIFETKGSLKFFLQATKAQAPKEEKKY